MQEITRLPILPARPLDSNKGTFGRVLVVAGSRGMSGAAVLCATAALRGGAGLVRLAVPQEIFPLVAAANPCYLTALLPQDAEGRLALAALPELLRLAQDHEVVALGPGFGKSPDHLPVLAAVLAQVRAPLVIDADGLNAFVPEPGKLGQHAGPVVITPHPGEFARLLQTDTTTVQKGRRPLAARFAAEHKLVVLLKGYGTIVTDGRRVYQNTTGNPGLATAGSGDVLTGLIAALLAQELEPFQAAQLGAFVHGRAGDLARDDLGAIGLMASDLLNFLPRALRF